MLVLGDIQYIGIYFQRYRIFVKGFLFLIYIIWFLFQLKVRYFYYNYDKVFKIIIEYIICMVLRNIIE